MPIKSIFIAAIVFSSSNTYAVYYSCSGKIEAINQAYDGSVSIVSTPLYGNGQGSMICSLNSEWKNVTPETCKGWLSKALSSEATSKDITIQYNDSITSCAGQPTWGLANNPWAIW